MRKHFLTLGLTLGSSAAALLICALNLTGSDVAFAVIRSPAHARPTAATSSSKQANRDTKLAAAIQLLLADPAVARDHWGISVTTLDGKSIYAMNDAQYFTPASNAKLFTTAAAMALLQEQATAPETALAHCGDAQGNVSSLELIGTGDPTFASHAFPYIPRSQTAATQPATQAATPLADLEAMADQVKAHGVRSVAGIIGDDSLYPFERYGTGWAWDDLQWSDGVPVTALTVNDNVVTLNLMPAADGSGKVIASWSPDVPYYTLDNQAITAGAGTKSQLGMERAPGSRTVRIFGSMPLDSKGAHLRLALEDPAEFAAAAFRQMLVSRGISVAGPSSAFHNPATRTTPFEDAIQQGQAAPNAASGQITGASSCRLPLSNSLPWLHQDIVVINKLSQNLHAELLLRRLGYARTFEGSFVEGARVVRQFTITSGVNADDFFFYDGSGMSPADIVTPRAITTLLTYAARQPWGNEWRASLPIAGVDGTLANRFTQSALKGKVFAKTGTLSEVNALSGYVIAATGKTIAFSILINNHRPGSTLNPDQGRAVMDKILEAIASAN